MPHIRRGFLEAWSRIAMSRLYCYRSADYFRQANKETDRRYILFNAIQKARAAAQNEAAVIIMHNIMAAKAYETNTFAETAVRNTGNAVRLEGTAHVNMGQAVNFMNNYFNNNVDLPEVPDGKMIKDDSSSMFDQGFGKVTDHTAIVRYSGGIQDRGMRHLAGGNVLEYNLALLFLAEGLIDHPLECHCPGIQIAQTLCKRVK